MTFYEGLQEALDKNIQAIIGHATQLENFSTEVEGFFKKIKKGVDEYRKNGKIPSFGREDLLNNVQIKSENLSPVKPTRKALRETQTRKEGNETQATKESVKVKQEKITNMLPQRESVENMPPPQALPIKKTIKTENTRNTRTRTRKQKKENQDIDNDHVERKDSDVVIQNASITLIEVSSDEEEQPPKLRSTRTRTRAAAKKEDSSTESTKRSRSASEDSNKSKSTRTKKKKAAEPEKNVQEDAITEKPLEKPKVTTTINNSLNVVHTQQNSNLKDIMTDDDSPVQSGPVSKAKNTKQLFSAFDHSPVKKKVEAFEKLGAAAVAAVTPVKQTRTRTRTQAKEKNESEEVAAKSGPLKTKPKMQTPLDTHRILPSQLANTTSKVTKSSLASPIPKTMSAIKASAAEFRERELKRQKEAEARQKREALLQAQIEEKRRIREEKQLKAQQLREAMEKEKKKHLEMVERVKEEKLKQQLAERDIKLQKQKDDLEKKRQMARQKASDEKVKDPIYMITKAPLLPTPDCYDSDSEDVERQKVDFPSWSKGKELHGTLKTIHLIGEQLKNSFFCRSAQTIDLTKVFQRIDPKKLKRTSSAMWTRPPRFTLMPQFNNSLDVTEEADENYSEDEN